MPWNFGLEPKKKRLKEQDFLENNSQISSVDFFHPRSVSTGLGLSLDNTRMASTGDSGLLLPISDDIDRELRRQDAEIDRLLKVQVLVCLKTSSWCFIVVAVVVDTAVVVVIIIVIVKMRQ